MYHVHQQWLDIEAMPIYTRKVFVRKFKEQREFEEKEIAEARNK